MYPPSSSSASHSSSLSTPRKTFPFQTEDLTLKYHWICFQTRHYPNPDLRTCFPPFSPMPLIRTKSCGIRVGAPIRKGDWAIGFSSKSLIQCKNQQESSKAGYMLLLPTKTHQKSGKTGKYASFSLLVSVPKK